MNRCANCDIELTGQGLQADDGTYCCSGCAEGGPCTCTYVDQPPARSGNGHADPVVTWELLGLSDRLGDDARGTPPRA
jgi:hypothetical protein